MAMVRVRLFARQRQVAGTREVRVELPDGAVVRDAWSAVVGMFPTLGSDSPYVRYARNGAYATPDEPVGEGDEIACIPPVAGGSPNGSAGDTAGEGRSGDGDGGVGERRAAGSSVRLVQITERAIDSAVLARLLEATASPADGAQVVFIGRTRETPGTAAPGQEAEAARHAGQRVRHLEYEAFESMALDVIDEIAAEVEVRFGVRRLAVVHRVGAVPVGEPSVAIVAGAPHRDAAFDACRHAIDELKARVPIWKAEHFDDGSVWMGAPARDRARPQPETAG